MSPLDSQHDWRIDPSSSLIVSHNPRAYSKPYRVSLVLTDGEIEMKYGVHLALWMARWSEEIDGHIRTAAELGFDGIEISLLGMSDEKVLRLNQAIRNQNLEVTCTTGLSVSDDVASDDEATRNRGIDYLRWAVQTTAGLGAKLLTGVLYAPWGHFVPGQKRMQDCLIQGRVRRH